jgi:3',5'-cyclic AMP phosphodiesterase CpdA
MPEFRLTQISDTHLARRLPTLTDNFHRVSEYIDARRPDLVVNSGDLAFDGPTHQDDLTFAKRCTPHSRFLAAICPAITTSATTRPRLVQRRRIRSPNQTGRRLSRPSVKTAGASRPWAGVSSASIRW